QVEHPDRHSFPTRRSSDLEQWEAENGRLQRGDIVVFDFDWAAKWAKRPHDAEYQRAWPGVGLENAELLIERQVKAVGVDTFSPEDRKSTRLNSSHVKISYA